MPELILTQLRCLHTVFDGSKLSTKLLEVVGVCPPNIQIDVIAAIPEIVTDASHAEIVSALRELATDNSELTVPVLDALANLDLPVELLEEVVTDVLGKLHAVTIEDLPVVIRFLLQTATKDNAERVVQTLRTSLTLYGVLDRKQHGSNTDGTMLVLDALRSGLRLRPVAAAAYLREIGKLNKSSGFRLMDFWVLFVLHGCSAEVKTKIEALLRRKVDARATCLLPLLLSFALSLEIYLSSA